MPSNMGATQETSVASPSPTRMTARSNHTIPKLCLMLVVALLTACGGGGGGDGGGDGNPGGGGTTLPQVGDRPDTDTEAARFLFQAGFGPTIGDIAFLRSAGYQAWFDQQASANATLQRPALEWMDQAGLKPNRNHRQELWWQQVVEGPDQLRQKMAWALSQIFVVSDADSALGSQLLITAEYYDTLTRHALGNYQDLMWAVTLSPAMGLYLSMLKNEKADPETNLRPDENYAREVMQLFSIGLVELNPNGSVKRDAQGEPIPTYSQSDVEELARIFTGWNFNGATNWKWPQKNYLPMQPWYAYHDFDAKVIVGNTAIPAGLTPDDDMGWAIHTLFHHPNTAPFVAFRLIQRLVTSNPSPAYVQRVAAVFADNGAGVRGDLYAVAKAILLDPEARFGHVDQPQTFGKLKEPLLRQAALWRAFDARSVDGAFREWRPETEFGQAALRSPSVFNFYQPDHKPAGALGDLGLYGPEFQITTHAMITRTTNRMYERTFRSYPGFANANERTVTLNLAAELALASDPAALVDRIALLLTADGLSSASRDLIIQHVNGVSMTAGNLESGMQRVLEAIYLIATSPEGAVQR